MIKQTVSYTGYDNESVTEDLYFNITKFEATELSLEIPAGIMNQVQNVNPEKAQDELKDVIDKMSDKELLDFLKLLVVKGYGKREGRLFLKDERTKSEFINSKAYHTLMMDFITDPNRAIEFMNHVFESDV